ncbi:hypothetical protein [Nonomuraea sp. SYSU D8015]|uniref:hypothetical protein n=1 Tax=Nonomuraea sp. SYSU D8015 TaxID=2593644 RepID=UPI0016607381|nr:hypothetical protein [Nonomuraea sp. SYSU D8015]
MDVPEHHVAVPIGGKHDRAAVQRTGREAADAFSMRVEKDGLDIDGAASVRARRLPHAQEAAFLVAGEEVRPLAVDDPGLVRVQPQPDLLHPLADRHGQHAGLAFAAAMTTTSSTWRSNGTNGNLRAIQMSKA